MATVETVTSVKICNTCSTAKPVDSFHRDPTKKDGKRGCCDSCARKRSAKWREQNKTKARNYISMWQKQNAPKIARLTSRRRSLKRGGVAQRWGKVESPCNLCYWCGVDLDNTPKHLDHIMPLSLGGPAHPNNEVWVCRTCNLKKHNKHPLVWLASLCSEDVA
jgi:hypothetical protein